MPKFMAASMISITIYVVAFSQFAHPFDPAQNVEASRKIQDVEASKKSPPGQERKAEHRKSELFASLRDSVDNGGPVAILQSGKISKLLTLTNEQKKKLLELKSSMRTTQRIAVREFLNSEPDVINSKREGMITIARGLQRSYTQNVLNVLNKSQQKLFWRFALQIEGPMALSWEEVQDALNIDLLRRESINDICNKYLLTRNKLNKNAEKLIYNFYSNKLNNKESAFGEFYNSNRIEFDILKKEEEALRNKTNTEVLRWITRNQKQKFLKMQGEPLDLDNSFEPRESNIDANVSKFAESQKHSEQVKAKQPP